MTQKRRYIWIDCPVCNRPTVLHWLGRHMWAKHSQHFIDQVKREQQERRNAHSR